jgi:hypothetical protein
MGQPTVFDRIKVTSTTTGTGNFTCLTSSGYNSLFDVTGYFYYCIENPSLGEWETGIGHASSSTVLVRDKIFANSGGSAVAYNFGAGTKNVFVTPLANVINLVDPGVCEGRLTLTSGTAVTTADVTGATTVYFTPYKGDRVSVIDYHDTNFDHWITLSFSEISIALGTITSGLPYDVFCYNNSGTLALEKLAWTDGDTRATDLTLVNGVYVKTGDVTRRYLGTFYTTSTTQTEDSESKRLLFNYYNRVPKTLYKTDTTTSWTYATATWRSWNASDTNRVAVITGVNDQPISLKWEGFLSTGAGNLAYGMGVCEDGTTTSHADIIGGRWNASTASAQFGFGSLEAIPSSVGYRFYQIVENSLAGISVTVNGNTGSNNVFSGLNGIWNC